jgi:hypothetical protein
MLKLNRMVKETRKYLADRRPKDLQMPSVLYSHYSVSVSLKGFTIYKRPLGIVICLNYTFSVPDKLL